MQRDRRYRQTEARGMPIASVDKIKGSPDQQENISQGANRTPELPQDIWYRIHSLLPLRDSARASRVSRAFQNSWRCHPNLTFSMSSMGLKSLDHINHQKNCQTFIKRVDQIMKNHSGIGVKTFEFKYYDSYHLDISQLNSWLEIAVTPGIEELDVSIFLGYAYETEKYNFPCSLLFAGSGGNSIRSLRLSCCVFRPMAGLGCLTRLHLYHVHITGDELGCLLSSSFALEKLSLKYCCEIICLEIPRLLHQFVKLTVSGCNKLAVIDNKAPNLRKVCIESDVAHISIGDSLQVKDLEMFCAYEFNLVYHGLAKFPASMPNLETLTISSAGEMFSTPSVPGKFLHLKHLNIHLEDLSGAFSPDYDYFSLIFFLDACPILETFRLEVDQTCMEHDSVEDSSHLRQMPGHRHGNIKKVEIDGFCSAKSMVELTCHILENATSLECLTLDTILCGYYKRCEDAYRLSDHEVGQCRQIEDPMIMEAHKALLAIERYVAVKVPSTVKLNVLKPCSRCHVLESCQPNVVLPPVGNFQTEGVVATTIV
ncbi:unnamed protein product [Alopecurus aequalis]